MAFTTYLKLIKFGNHWSFPTVAIFALFFSSTVSQDLIKSLILLYFSFSVFLYGGIYALNDIFDVESDKKHSIKRKRPLPSGEIKARTALLFSLILISLGLFTGLVFFGVSVFYIYLLFLLLNLFYTLIAKRVPYLDLFGNAAPHALRMVLAFFVIGNMNIPYFKLAAYLFLSVGMTTIRRLIEKEAEGDKARFVLKHYTKHRLMLVSLSSLLLIIALSAIDAIHAEDKFRHAFFYSAITVIYLAYLLGVTFSKRFKAFFTWINP